MAAAVMNMSPTPPSTSPKRRRSPNLSIDLTDLPPLSEPTPPSNTLLVTNLQSLEIFTAANLDSIQRAIAAHAPIHTFAPLRSFRRIIVSFYTVDAAVALRKILDGEAVLGNRIRVYFGQPTKLAHEDQHLQAPKSQKLFFISPPPSPPVGWEMRNEGPPNKDVHAEDLSYALSRLRARPTGDGNGEEDDNHHHNASMKEGAAEGTAMMVEQEGRSPVKMAARSRSSTLVFDPLDEGNSPDLPAIAVEDTSASPGDLSPMEGVEKKFVHTSRPPVELMEQ